MEPSNYLAVTAIGTDRTGIVSQLTKVVSECNCNIVDSRMAIFGNEFTFIMLLSGDNNAITLVEHQLPTISYELELLTMTKRTSKHVEQVLNHRMELTYEGPDSPGTLSKITTFLAENSIGISSLKTSSEESGQQTWIKSSIELRLPEGIDIANTKDSIVEFCAQCGLSAQLIDIHQ